jgi:hypothetical protein
LGRTVVAEADERDTEFFVLKRIFEGVVREDADTSKQESGRFEKGSSFLYGCILGGCNNPGWMH